MKLRKSFYPFTYVQIVNTENISQLISILETWRGLREPGNSFENILWYIILRSFIQLS